MKLSDQKIEALASKLLAWMENNPEVDVLEPPDEIHRAIVDEFQKEKDLERELDDAVDRILEENASRMQVEGLDHWMLRKKIRQQLARERRMIL